MTLAGADEVGVEVDGVVDGVVDVVVGEEARVDEEGAGVAVAAEGVDVTGEVTVRETWQMVLKSKPERNARGQWSLMVDRMSE